jgi:ATP-dependent exoDNAse (exonuclease V) beta subunit
MQKHISFSELKTWDECPYKQKLSYVDRVNVFEGNEYTAFGTSLHEVAEKLLVEDIKNPVEVFNHDFSKRLKELNIDESKDLVKGMYRQAPVLIENILPALNEYFEDYEVVSTEEMLYEDIENYNPKFKGYVDLVIKSGDKYHVIDWKTCSWGWDTKRKSDRMTTYQLTLYKHFFAKKHSIDPKDIETHFALMKRTAKKNVIEIFRVTSGAKKTENALKLLNKALYNIEKNNFIKNRLSCTSGFKCEYYKTKFCS